MIREVTRGRGIPDEISEVLGSQIYAQNYAFNGLRDAVLTRFSTQILPVSRYYMHLNPKVVVDFEPNPLDGLKFYVDEKRKFFNGLNILYVPVFIVDRLTKEQFKERVERERAVLGRGYQEAMEDAALAQINDRSSLDADTLAKIDAEVHRRVEDIRKTKHLYGIALTRTIANVKRNVVVEVLKERMKHGGTGTGLSTRDSSFAAR